MAVRVSSGFSGVLRGPKNTPELLVMNQRPITRVYSLLVPSVPRIGSVCSTFLPRKKLLLIQMNKSLMIANLRIWDLAEISSEQTCTNMADSSLF